MIYFKDARKLIHSLFETGICCPADFDLLSSVSQALAAIVSRQDVLRSQVVSAAWPDISPEQDVAESQVAPPPPGGVEEAT